VVPDSNGVQFNQAGTFFWQAVYSGDANNNGATSACQSETLVIAPNVSQITPTATTCTQFNAGTAATLDTLNHSVKNGKISQVAPGVFFYWTKVTVGSAGPQTFTINQQITTGNFNTYFQSAAGSAAYTSGCTKLNTSITQSGANTTVSFNASSAGTYIIGIKYSSGSVNGAPAPNPTTVHYDFSTTGVPGTTSGLDLKIKQ